MDTFFDVVLKTFIEEFNQVNPSRFLLSYMKEYAEVTSMNDLY